jgi:hypothetical protein
MARVTAAEVEKIIDLDSDLDADPFINSANLLITDVLGDAGMSEERLTDIELWLSAHFCAMRQRQISNIQMGGIGLSFGGNLAGTEGLKLSHYGQQALALDTSGRLGRTGKPKVIFEAL